MDTEFLFLNRKNRERYYRIVHPFGNLLARIGVHPHILSVAGLLLSAASAVVYGTGSFFRAAWILVIAGICDTLDGQIARQTGKESPFGSFFDSFLDRYSDVFILAGLAFYFAGGGGALHPPSPWTVLVIVLAISGSFMVSYARARAEGLGLDCKIGLMQRPERITLLVIGSLLGALPAVGTLIMKISLLILALSSNFTAVHRLVHVRNQFHRPGK